MDLLVDRLLAKLGEGAVCRLEPVARHRPEQAEQAVTPGREPVPWREAPPDASEAPPDAPEAPATPQRPQRPFRLFDRPEPVEVMAEVPDGPPLLFIWRRVRRRVARAAGPERIEPEWWTGAGAGGRDEAVRDYYRIEDADGRRYWLYRAGLYGDGGGDGGGDTDASTGTGRAPRWYVHGLYG